MATMTDAEKQVYYAERKAYWERRKARFLSKKKIKHAESRIAYYAGKIK